MKVGKVGYDLKPLLRYLKLNGITVRGEVFDAGLANVLTQTSGKHSIENLAESLAGFSLAPSSNEPAPGEQVDGTYAEALAQRCDLTGQLRERLDLKLTEQDQKRVCYEIEMPLLPVLVDMETDGIRLDGAALAEFDESLTLKTEEQREAIYRLAGREFNINATQEIGRILFEELRVVDSPKRTRTGLYATDEQTLSELVELHELPTHILKYRELNKLKTTYLDVLPKAVNPATGRIHTTYHQLDAATGRLSSTDPNLQNIPIRSALGQEVRKAFVPRNADFLLLSADYSQIELRILAALSQESALLAAFLAGEDVHVSTAAKVYGVSANQVTPEMRDTAKMVNYGVSYGMSAFGLAQRLGISRAKAAAFIDKYFATFPGIGRYNESSIEFARRTGYVQTVTGRRRYLPDINSRNATIRKAAERNAVNMPIQGTAADMIKLAMISIHSELTKRKCKTRLLLQVHDELVFDLFKPEQDEVTALVEEKMRTALPLDVPIEVQIGTGNNWLEAH